MLSNTVTGREETSGTGAMYAPLLADSGSPGPEEIQNRASPTQPDTTVARSDDPTLLGLGHGGRRA